MYSVYYFDTTQKLQSLHTMLVKEAFAAYKNQNGYKIMKRGDEIIEDDCPANDKQKRNLLDDIEQYIRGKKKEEEEQKSKEGESPVLKRQETQKFLESQDTIFEEEKNKYDQE